MKTKKISIPKLINWLDQNLLAVLAGFLLVLIPLMPKIPLMDIIPGYIVRVRIEDFAILGVSFIWLIQVLRKKVSWKHPLFYLIVAYIAIGFLSTLSALFVTKTVPLDLPHVGKLYLHYFRRIEYFMLAFIFYSAVKTKKQAKAMLWILMAVMVAVSVYGFGQKYFYWPVYSTMNREFSKGMRLYLTEHARVPSTFGGHYDLAAFSVVVLTILLAILLLSKKKWHTFFTGAAFVLGYFLLILTASRTSFIAYLFSVTVLFGLLLLVRNWRWIIPRWIVTMVFSALIVLSFGDMSDRFSQVPAVRNFKEKMASVKLFPEVEKPKNAISTDEIALISSPSDQPPTPVKPVETPPKQVPAESSATKSAESVVLPGDVYEDIPDVIQTATGSVEVKRTYSDNAHKYGLSASIRYDTLWPRALEGFKKNPLLGSGYSTLTKESVGHFTEAESTDNDFLRTLGETGLLGFISFYGIVVGTIFYTYKKISLLKRSRMFLGFSLAMIAGSFGLLLNAVYIDVFAASKVAEIYWALVGLLMAILYEILPKKRSKES